MTMNRKTAKIDYRMKILVAEDFATMRKIMCCSLKEMGFTQVFEAEDGLSAWEIIRREDLGLVVTDWHMPRMGGLELLQKIRALPRTRSLPVLMITIEEHRDYLIAAVQAGVDNYLIKPFTPEVLKEKIEQIFSRVGAGGKFRQARARKASG
jgi:two-component system chemotaxis response regulator CheY